MAFQIHCANPDSHQAPDTINYVSKLGIDPNYVIARDKKGDVLSYFKDNKWDLRVYGANNTFNFVSWWDAKTQGPMDALARRLTEEIKTVCWLNIFETATNAGRSRGMVHVRQSLSILRAIAKLAHGLNLSLTEADTSLQFQVALRCSISNVDDGFSLPTALMGLLRDIAFWQQLNTIECDVPRLVPEANLTDILTLIQSKARTREDQKEHHPLIPTRLLGKIIGGAQEQLKAAEPYLPRLEAYIKAMNADPSLCSNESRSYAENLKRVMRLYPNCTFQTWPEVKEHSLNTTETLERFGLTAYAKQVGLNNLKSIDSHITHLQVLCIFLIHAFSGMRISEVQVMPFRPIVNSTTKGLGNLPVFVSYLQKFTQQGHYSRPLVWATSKEGLYAASIAQQLSTLTWFRSHQIGDELPNNAPLFIGKGFYSITPNVHYSLPIATTLFDTKSWRAACLSLDLTIKAEDLEELRVFDAFRAWDENPNFAVGKLWPLSSHQFRRSVAVYASRSGMVSLPTLKTQFKHLSEVMTALYSENSSYAQNFLIDESGRPIDGGSVLMSFRDAAAFNTSVRFHEQVIRSEQQLCGPIGADIQRAKDRNSLPRIFHSQKETQMAVKQGKFSFKETPVGGCVLKGSCPHFAIDLVLPCTSGCKHAILKPEKLETYIESLRFDLASISPKSRPYQLINQEIDFINSTYLKPATTEQ